VAVGRHAAGSRDGFGASPKLKGEVEARDRTESAALRRVAMRKSPRRRVRGGMGRR
jgi:hypothetical protein